MANLGLSFISPAPQVSAEFFLQLAKHCEEIGLHSLWINDRLVYDNFEPLAALAAAAGATRKIQLGTSVLLLPYRRPVLLAKTLATIDFISQGRLTLGVGVGNRESDYDAVGVPFERRGARGLESIQLMRRLWQEDNVTFGENFSKRTTCHWDRNRTPDRFPFGWAATLRRCSSAWRFTPMGTYARLLRSRTLQ